MTPGRYFYTDPLAAAWMLEHFGMKLVPDAWTESWLDDWWHAVSFQHPRFEGRYYIHPDSLHLLEPQVGDVVRCGGFSFDLLEDCEGSKNGLEVAQRNGKPFHWPESVAA